MSSIDERIVDMQFNNKQFQRGVAETNKSLGKLKDGLNLNTSAKSLQDLQNVGKKFSLANIASSVENISSRFTALGIVGVTALMNIANRAVDTGISLAKSLTIEPIMDGYREYELQMNSIQTILANTMSKGSTLKDVNEALEELNTYADQTIYNFAEMTRNIGTFTAAGVDLETSTAAIKGIANLAAISGSNSQQASTAMYQLSQAMAAGTVKLMDWNSVVNAGMGGKVFQEALFETGKAMGTISTASKNMSFEQWEKAGNTFRDSLQDGWITAEVLTNTLQGFTGDLDAAQLKSMGYNEEQIKQITKMGEMGKEAATKVKTMTQLIDTLKEGVGSGWAVTWQTIFGDFEEAKALYTGVSDALGEMISKQADARNELLKGWKDLGGRDALFEGIKNSFQAIVLLIKPIKAAFRDIFPPTTAKQLYEITNTFRNFTANLRIGHKTAVNLRRTFRGIFAVFGIGWEIVKGLAGVFFELFGATAQGAGGVLAFTANIGDFLYSVHQAIKNGEGLSRFFDGLAAVLLVPINLIKILSSAIFGFFSGFSGAEAAANGLSSASESLKDRMEPLVGLGARIYDAFGAVGRVFERLWNFFKPLGRAIGDILSNVGKTLGEAFSNADYSTALDAINVGLLGGLVLLFKKFFDDFSLDFGQGGVVDSIKGTFDALTGQLEAMQANVKASAILKIAAALGILTASALTLSLIDSAKLTKALTALGVMFIQLTTAIALLMKSTNDISGFKLAGVAASLVVFASAIVILTGAVAILSRLSWNELAKGMAGLGATLGIIVTAMNLIGPAAPGLIRTSAAMILVGTALRILASAVKAFSTMDWKAMGKGLAGVTASLLILAGFTRIVGSPERMIMTGAGILLVSMSLKKLYESVEAFSTMRWKDMGKGLVGLAGGLLAIALGMQAMPPTMLLNAAGLLLISKALKPLGEAIGEMGSLSWKEIGKGLATLAGSLLILAGAMYLMTGSISGAAALLIVVHSLDELVEVLEKVGGLSWKTILTSIGKLATALGLISVIGLVVSPLLLALGAAMVVLGAGSLATGAGLALMGVGLTAISVAGVAAAEGLKAVLKAIIEILPEMATQFAKAGINFIDTLAEGMLETGPKVISAAAKIFGEVLDSVVELAPKAAEAAVTIVVSFVKAVADRAWELGDAGIRLLAEFAKGLANETEIKKLVDSGAKIVVYILEGLGSNAEMLVEAIFGFVIDILETVRDAIAKYAPKLRELGAQIVWEIINGMTFGVPKKAWNLLPDSVKGPLEALVDGGAMHGLGEDFSEGLADGIDAKAYLVERASRRLANKALNSLGGALAIASPSKETMRLGVFAGEGLAIGITNTSKMVENSGKDIVKNTLGEMGKALKDSSMDITSGIDTNPKIRPVMDLADIRMGSEEMAKLIASKDISIGSSLYAKASTISSERRANMSESLGVAATKQVTNQPTSPIQFIQNNHSPKALSSIEIYRQTKNQLSAAKGALI